MNKATTMPRQEEAPNLIPPALDWESIDTVLLDMDGTLLDKYYDDYFWETYVPQVYGEKHGLEPAAATEKLMAKYRSVESTLQWTDLYYWKGELGLDMIKLKREVAHLINVHEYAVDFLRFVRDLGKKCCLITNAHSKALEVKLDTTGIGEHFDTIICSEQVGYAKEEREFWPQLATMLEFTPKRTLFADDTEKVLDAAKTHEIEHLVHVAKASSQLPVKASNRYPSIIHFGELIDKEHRQDAHR